MKNDIAQIEGWLKVASTLAVSGAIALSGDGVLAQQSNIIPDSTLGNESSIVVPNFLGFPVEIIDGGAERGQNLFHSFQEFNVSEGRGAYFYSPSAAIQNILSRVTGGNPSTILGTLGTFGESNPNLFLINPNGIIFGEDASLDVGGSFVATTASGIRLGNNGIFNAFEPAASNLLTVTPSALFFNALTNQGEIINRSTATTTALLGISFRELWSSGSFVFPNISGLQVLDNHSLFLVGGDISLEGGIVSALGGQIELGGLMGVGVVGLNVDSNTLSLSFPDSVDRVDVSFTNGSQVNVTAGDGGSVAINARDLDISGDSSLFAGIGEGLGASGSQAGDITLNATGAVTIANSIILNNVASEAVGKGGDISINTQELSVTDGSIVSARTFGLGDAGNVTIDTGRLIVQDGSFISASTADQGQAGTLKVMASDSIELVGTRAINTPDGLVTLPSSLLAQTFGNGTGGNLIVETKNLTIQDGAGISVSTFNEGQGGTLMVNASDTVELIGTSSSITSAVGAPLASLLLAATFGSGDAGNLQIDTKKLIVRDGAQIQATTAGEGQGGNIEVNASESVELIGTSSVGGFYSGLFTEALRLPDTTDGGNAGKLTIETGQLMLQDGARVSTATSASGNGGDIDIKVGSVSVANGAQINASTNGEGRAGNISIDARDAVTLDGNNTGLFANTSGQQDAGNLTIDTQELAVRNGAKVEVRTAGSGDAGSLTVRASQAVEVSGESADGDFSFLSTATESSGNAGKLTIETGQLVVRDGGVVSTSTFFGGEGKGGNLHISAAESVEIIGTTADGQSPSGLSAETRGFGDAGNFTVETRRLIIRDGGTVTAETFGEGNGGNLTVNASELVEVTGGAPDASFSSGLSAETRGFGDAGNLEIITSHLVAQDGGFVAASAREGSTGSAGNIIIKASDLVEVIGITPDGDFSSGISTAVEENTEGNGGDLTIQTQRLSVRDGAIVSASTAGSGRGGDIDIQAESVSLSDRAEISAQSVGTGTAGNISIRADESVNASNSDIATSANQSIGGAINIVAGNIRLRGDSDIRTNVASGEGGGGNIALSANSVLAFDDSDILAFARDGQGGNIILNTPVFFAENFQPAAFNTNPDNLEGNNRADVNASGAVAGVVTVPDVSFIQNSLTDLPENPINTDTLIANSCIARSPQQGGNFLVTGADSLPLRPGDSVSTYPTGTVQSIPNNTSSRPWRIGDPIVEPQGVYRLANGRLLLSRECL